MSVQGGGVWSGYFLDWCCGEVREIREVSSLQYAGFLHIHE